MRTKAAFAVIIALSWSTAATAETTVTLSDMHLCCGACVRAVQGAVKEVDGAQVAVNREGKSATITAATDEAAQKAVDALAAAGFHGKSDSETVKMKDDSGVKPGQVTRLELSGIHNCCGGCNVAIKKAIKAVPGVEADTAKPKTKSLVVEGNFDGAALVKSLLAAGFHVKLKK